MSPEKIKGVPDIKLFIEEGKMCDRKNFCVFADECKAAIKPVECKYECDLIELKRMYLKNGK